MSDCRNYKTRPNNRASSTLALDVQRSTNLTFLNVFNYFASFSLVFRGLVT